MPFMSFRSIIVEKDKKRKEGEKRRPVLIKKTTR